LQQVWDARARRSKQSFALSVTSGLTSVAKKGRLSRLAADERVARKQTELSEQEPFRLVLRRLWDELLVLLWFDAD
jgi:hypothetical protein